MRFFSFVLPLSLIVAASPALAQVRLLDCARSSDPAYCRQTQEKHTAEVSKAPKSYTTMRNVAYCLWTGCDGAMQVDRKSSCAIRRNIMKMHHSSVDRGDEGHFATCVQAGY